MSRYLKRLEAGKFIWPVSRSGDAVQISAVQLGHLLEGIDRRNPRWTQCPAKAGQIALTGLFLLVLHELE